MQEGVMQEGKVKWSDPERGFGFIRPDNGGKDVFLHISDLRDSGYLDVEKGDLVEFEIKQGNKGERAVNITIFDLV